VQIMAHHYERYYRDTVTSWTPTQQSQMSSVQKAISLIENLEDGDDAKNQEILKGLRSVLEDLRGNPTNFKGEF
jgi:hypothetical protein